MKFYIGIDNGVTGSIAVIGDDRKLYEWHKTPTFDYLMPTKTKRNMRRIERKMLRKIMYQYKDANVKVVMENPMIHFSPDGARFFSTISAVMAYEATVAVIEDLALPFEQIGAVTWQRVLLPNGIKKGDKKPGIAVAKRLYPDWDVPKGSDADAILIAEYSRRYNL